MVDIPQIDAAAMRVAFPEILRDCAYMGIGVGWRRIVGEMCAAFATLPKGYISVLEMEQKWGELRVSLYVDSSSPELRPLARHVQILATERSRFTCEVCGAPGLIHRSAPASGAWLYCLCPRHLPPERRDWPLVRHERRYEIDGIHWKYDHLLDRLRVDETGNA